MIDKRILSRKRLTEISLSFNNDISILAAFEESKHPRDHGKFTFKNGGKSSGSGGSGSVISSGKSKKKRSVREVSQQVSQQVSQPVQQPKQQPKQQQSKHEFKEWESQIRAVRNETIAQQAREGEYQPEHAAKSSFAEHAAKEAGIIYGLGAIKNVGKKFFGGANKTKEIVTAEIVPESAETRKKAVAAAKAAAGPKLKKARKLTNATARSAGIKNAQKAANAAYKATIKDLAGKVGASATVEEGATLASKAVGGSRLKKAASAIFGIGTLIPRLSVPHLAIATAVAAAGYYGYKKYQQKQRQHEIMQHERELMKEESESAYNSDDDRQFNKEVREKTAREVARQASVYAAKQYSQQQVSYQKQAIDEELSTGRVQRKMRRSARITAYAAAKEYARQERTQAYKTRESDSFLY